MSRKESVLSVKFVVGDKVRISDHIRLFEKGATANWSEEVYEVSEILPTRPITYRLRDLAGEDIQGAFYNEQLQRQASLSTESTKFYAKREDRMVSMKYWYAGVGTQTSLIHGFWQIWFIRAGMIFKI